MITVSALRKEFCEKLEATGNIDAAFTKAVWAAYKAGYTDGGYELREHCKTIGMALTESKVGQDFYKEHIPFTIWVATMMVLADKANASPSP